MVMETTLRANTLDSDALRTLTSQLYTVLGETSLGLKCTFKNNRLVVLGEHAADTPLDSSNILDRLERNIQALHLQFTQQVRLYLRQLGQRQPYAYRQFVVAPPPPSLAQGFLHDSFALLEEQPVQSNEEYVSGIQSDQPTSQFIDHSADPVAVTQPITDQNQPPSAIDEQPWIVGDAELDALVSQLTSLDPLENWEAQTQNYSNTEANAEEIEGTISVIDVPLNDQDVPRLIDEPTIGAIELDVPVTEAEVLALSSALGEAGVRHDGDAALLEKGLLEDGLIPNATELSIVHKPEDSVLTSSVGWPALIPTDEMVGSDPSNGREVILRSAPESLPQDLGAMNANVHQSSLVISDLGLSEENVLQPGVSSFTYETSQRLKELSQALLHPKANHGLEKLEKADSPQPTATAQLENQGSRRLAIATMGLASLGFAAGLYGATRPCVIGGCVPLSTADQLGDKSQRMMQQAQTWTDLEAIIPPLTQAVEVLEPVPVWSSHAKSAQAQKESHARHLGQINQMIEVEQAVKHANQLSAQTVYSFEDLQTTRSLWQSAIDDLELVPLDSPLHGFAQTHLANFQPQLVQSDQQLQTEKKANATLDMAREAARLAQVRQGVAQSLENWQFVRVTWLVALNRLKEVESGTLAAQEAERLMPFYQTSLDEVNAQVSREKGASASLKKAQQHAQIANASEERHDWKQAIADWNNAIQYTQQIDSGSTYYLKAEGLLTQYKDAVTHVQEKLKAKTLIEGELKQSCLGELKLCHIVSIDQSIKLRLDESYMDAISTARGNGNYNLQAVVTDHQLMVRKSLDRIANSFDLPIEVYNPDGGLLERHIPKP